MNIPSIIILEKHMKDMEKFDQVICEIFQILIARIDELERRLDDGGM
tara:strand:+ start:2177 stop:2317 length:141 start_codon:yes stop_codon:yes gene_type:complete